MATGSTPRSTPNRSGRIRYCAICDLPTLQLLQLPCNHVFCHFCLKGEVRKSKKCTVCDEVLTDLFVDGIDSLIVPYTMVFEHTYQWYYGEKKGEDEYTWFKFDDQNNAVIEAAFDDDVDECEIRFEGIYYIIDFLDFTRGLKSDLSKMKKIKREIVSRFKVAEPGKWYSPEATLFDAMPRVVVKI